MTVFIPTSDLDLLKATLFNRSRPTDLGCWEWTHTRDTGGYGLFCRNGRYVKAHRLSFEIWKGPIPKGLHILHACDNPACINPDHLRAGTVKENMADREARGRRDVRGEQVGTAKLTEAQVIEIRKSKLGLADLSVIYGVDRSNIWAIRSRKSWRHIPETIAEE